MAEILNNLISEKSSPESRKPELSPLGAGGGLLFLQQVEASEKARRLRKEKGGSIDDA